MRRAGAIVLVVALWACGGSTESAGKPSASRDDKGWVSLQRVIGRESASQSSPVVRTLARGTEVRVRAWQDGFARVEAEGGRECWVPEDALETSGERERRLARTEATAAFATETGQVVERTPVLLGADWGGARWADLGPGDLVAVVLADHDFYGVRLPGAGLAFVPARSVRLMARPATPTPAPAGAPEALAGTPGRAGSREGPVEIPGPGIVPGTVEEPAPDGPLLALPPGGRPPVLTRRVDPRYPETARRSGIAGEVVLRVVVEANGEIGEVDVVSGAPAGLTEAAAEAVRRWEYEPALVDGQAVAVYKTIRVRFSLPPG